MVTNLCETIGLQQNETLNLKHPTHTPFKHEIEAYKPGFSLQNSSLIKNNLGGPYVKNPKEMGVLQNFKEDF